MLKDVRKKAGLSQSGLAEKAGVNLRYLQELEQGRKNINNVNLLTLLKICKALDCQLNNILTDKETVELLSEVEKSG